jgi:deazaflavin-dependent oxidoreductase (nitroreductase family)
VLGQVAVILVVLAMAGVAVALTFVLGMRTKSRLVLRPLIALQRRVINPRQMQSAGTPGAYASVIRHRGRTSGQLYSTPVDAIPTDDGFAIALVYGPRSNWVRNVLASGSATIVHEGSTTAVDRPEIVPMPSVADRFDAGDLRGFRVLGVNQAILLRRAVRSAPAAS